jgi:hypothetical protein
MTEAYPLHWPEGRRRTEYHRRQRSRFNTGFGIAVREVIAELKRLGARNAVVSTNVPLRRDGLPLASAKSVSDPGVAVYFRYKDKPMTFACDRWDKPEDNLWAIAKTIDAMRGISRWGSGDMLDTAFSGFVSLPPPKSPWTILGVDKRSATRDVINARWRDLAKQHHADAGGSTGMMAEINVARDNALREIGAA